MKNLQRLLLSFALVFGVNLGILGANQNANQSTDLSHTRSADLSKSANLQITDSKHSTNITAFAMMPPLTVLLEILYPQGMIGLNYEPYPEDKDFMPQKVAKLPVLGMQKGNEPIFEKIIALKPSVIFFNEGVDKKVRESYEKFGIRVIEVSAFDESKLNETIKIYGNALGVENRANELLKFIDSTNTKMQILSQKITHRPKIYFAQGVDGLATQCGKKDDKNELAHKIGGINAIDCGKDYGSVNFEILYKANPEVIFVREIALYRQLRKNPPKQWQGLSAIQNKRVYYAPSTPSNWLMKPPSVMQVIGVPFAFAKVHSEILSEAEARAIAKDFFATFLRDLSDKDYARISGE